MKNAPIVLVHGICGFNKLTVGGSNVAEYFRGIPDALRNAGYTVPEPPALPPTASIVDRARALKTYLNSPSLEGQRVHIIAHSMGGLDARYLISSLGMADRVLSLTTIGTPHLGSPIADLIEAKLDPVLGGIAASLELDIDGIHDLTTQACADFNRANKDNPNVCYFYVSGSFSPSPMAMPFNILGYTCDVIQRAEGDNDGLVSVTSAAYGGTKSTWINLGAWKANHFRLINWGKNIVPSLSENWDKSIVNNYLAMLEPIMAETSNHQRLAVIAQKEADARAQAKKAEHSSLPEILREAIGDGDEMTEPPNALGGALRALRLFKGRFGKQGEERQAD